MKKKIKAFITRINDFRQNRHVARLPGEVDDRPLITHTVVELPSPHLHLESQQSTDSPFLILESPMMDGDSDPPSFSRHLEFADDADITTGAATQATHEEADHQLL